MAALEVVKIDMKQMTAIPQETSQTCWLPGRAKPGSARHAR
ncbi:MAG: hypothetical protein P9E24_10475 [Candidatus Competibacter sp.]|nr:hypothetical protein [Candidatus Competibacter sp.]MDG4583336.1 hypothetical protein [Candidatus Competibacter sp.]